MARGPRYAVAFRRRREGKTDYKARLGLIRSGKPRAIVRVSNRYVYVQIAESRPGGDTVTASASSRELAGLGWKAGTGNIPSAYLTGALAGRRGLAKGVKEAILDIGLRSSTKGSRLYAALKGLADAGLQVPHSEDILPSGERVEGGHIAGFAKLSMAQSAETYRKRFGGYLSRGLKPEELTAHFGQVREQIRSMKVEA